MNRRIKIPLQTDFQLFHRMQMLFPPNILPWIIILGGIVLRVIPYLLNRSLWLDEAMLALNIVDRSFLELLQPLDYNQGAPVGFLLLEKIAIQSFGNNEYALRFFPFLFGILSLYLFYKVTQYCLDSGSTLIALGLFVLSNPLNFYASEVKQYSCDVAITLLLFLITLHVQRSRALTLFVVLLFGGTGAIAIWLSHPAVFTLAGCGISLICFALIRKDRGRVKKYVFISSLWLASFGVCYVVSLRAIARNQTLVQYWNDYFMPFPPFSFSGIQWFMDTFFQVFDYPVGITLTGIAALSFLVGCIFLYSVSKERLCILLSPIFFVLSASALRKYPFGERLLLFLAPSLLLILAIGAEQIRRMMSTHSVLIGAIFLAMLFFHPFLSSLFRVIVPYTIEDIKPVLAYIDTHKQPRDKLYIYWKAVPAFRYYSQKYDFPANDYIAGIVSDDWEGYIADLTKIRNYKRVWILFSHVLNSKDEEFFLTHLNALGTKLDSMKSTGVSVYLYNFKELTTIEEKEREILMPLYQ